MESTKKHYKSGNNPFLLKPTRPFPKEVAIIGAGTIGPDIGYYLLNAIPSIKLFLIDVDKKALQKAKERYTAYTGKAVAGKKIKEEQANAILQNVTYTTDYNEIKNCDLVIEAATESISLKRKIFDMVEQIVDENTIITSNTSSIPAERLFSHLKHPERTTVTHFFAPAWRSLPVEVIDWKKGSQQTLDYLFWLFAVTGKVPIITEDALCFALDRIFDNWCNEAAFLLDQATASQIDKVSEEFVFAGPFFVLNLANGNPIIVETINLQSEEGDSYQPAPILDSVDRWQTHRLGTKVEVPDKVQAVVRDRLLATLFSQSFDIINRGICTKSDLNYGCQIALGFRKGPFDIMKDLGEEEVKRILSKFNFERPGFPQPTAPLGEYQDFNRHILVDNIENIIVITIRRPQAMNALNDEVTDEILSVLEEFTNDSTIRGFVITGYGNNAFSAGADIGKFPEMLDDKAASEQYAKDCAKVQKFMDQMKLPVVAALNGITFGGGLELAIRCHDIVAMKKAKLQFPEISLGILPGIGGCVVPYRKWPKGAALFHEMITLGKPIKAQEAFDVGMISEIVEDYNKLIHCAVKKVDSLQGKIEQIAEGPVEIPEFSLPEKPMFGNVVLSKGSLNLTAKTIQKGAAAGTLEEALEIGYQGFGEIACLDSAKEGISAFLQKRKPDFKN